MTRPRRFIIDTDPGVDDAHAILMALSHPGIRVEAITTVSGNVGLEHTTRNAGAILDVAKAEIPIFAGAEGPLVGSRLEAAEVHGADGLGDVGRSVTARRPEGEHAATALVRLARNAPRELTLVALGPLTNLALAVRLAPELPQLLARLVVMGGAVRGTGNSSPVAEFNIQADPEAAAVVFATWPDITLVTWEATLAHPLPSDLLQRAEPQTPRLAFLREVSAHAIAHVSEVFRLTELYAPDPLAMAVALEPDIVQREVRCAINVELAGSHTRGQTVADLRGAGSGPVRVIEEVDRDRLRELLLLAVR